MPKTGATNGHSHEFEPGAARTAPAGDGHSHGLTAGADKTGPGGDDNHTHPVQASAFATKPDLREIEGVEVFRTGRHRGVGSAPNGDVYTLADLDAMVAAFNDLEFKPPVKLGHVHKPGEPANGFVKALRRIGDRLVADFMDVPAAVFEAIRARRFDTVSAEIAWNFRRGEKAFRRVLTAVALLGAEIPAVDLKPLRTVVNASEIGEFECALTYSFDLNEDPDMEKIQELEAKLAEATKKLTAAADADATHKTALEALTKKLAIAVKASDGNSDAALEVKKLSEKVEELTKASAKAEEARRKEYIDNRVKDCGIPAIRDHVRALYDMATIDPERTVEFKIGEEADGTTKFGPVNCTKVVDDLLRVINGQTKKLFEEFGHSDRNPRREFGEEKSPGEEIDALTRAAMAKDADLDYAQASERVLADPANAELKRAYARS